MKHSIKITLLSFLSLFFSLQIVLAQDAATEQEFRKINNLLYLLDNNYVDTINMHSIVEEVIVKTLQDLDPHSVYIPKEELAKMNEPLVGNFEGIGIQFNILADTILVVKVLLNAYEVKKALLLMFQFNAMG